MGRVGPSGSPVASGLTLADRPPADGELWRAGQEMAGMQLRGVDGAEGRDPRRAAAGEPRGVRRALGGQCTQQAGGARQDPGLGLRTQGETPSGDNSRGRGAPAREGDGGGRHSPARRRPLAGGAPMSARRWLRALRHRLGGGGAGRGRGQCRVGAGRGRFTCPTPGSHVRPRGTLADWPTALVPLAVTPWSSAPPPYVLAVCSEVDPSLGCGPCRQQAARGSLLESLKRVEGPCSRGEGQGLCRCL